MSQGTSGFINVFQTYPNILIVVPSNFYCAYQLISTIKTAYEHLLNISHLTSKCFGKWLLYVCKHCLSSFYGTYNPLKRATTC
jgi:hypothetical protein